MQNEKPNRYERRRQRTREAIIVAAAEVFEEKGVAHTTVANIADLADIGYGTFYNHFHSLGDVISAVAEASMIRVVRTAETITPREEDLDLAPAISARVVIRVLSKDPAVRWLLEQPYVFIDEWHKTITPFARKFIDRERGNGQPEPFQAMGGLETLLRMGPWMLMSELNHAIETGSSAAHEENLTQMIVRLMGVDDERSEKIVATSRSIVNAAKLPPA